ncbi:MAG TPA: hypothetical protein VG147_09705 [Solirubrobacteraceae bacterium]|nr:hypothetical protein [Solirubrobacteraceae bacterium]
MSFPAASYWPTAIRSPASERHLSLDVAQHYRVGDTGWVEVVVYSSILA